MSLIYVAKVPEEATTIARMIKLYGMVDVASKGRGKVRFDWLLAIEEGKISSLIFAMPHKKVERITVSLNEMKNDIAKGKYTLGAKIFGNKLVVERTEVYEANISKFRTQTIRHKGYEYTILEVLFEETLQHGNYAFSFSMVIPDVAAKLSGGLLYETTWALDITLYGPVSPRSHIFLEKETITRTFVPIEQGYLEIRLPINTHCLKYFPPLLEEYLAGDRLNMMWVIGRLMPWYERRIHLVYASPPGKMLLSLLLAVLAILLALLGIIVTLLF